MLGVRPPLKCETSRTSRAMTTDTRMVWRMNLFPTLGTLHLGRPRKEVPVKRFHSEVAHMRREHRVHCRVVHARWSNLEACAFEALGRFRKRKALDCGKARCSLCSGEKIHKIQSYQDRLRN